MTKKSFLAIIFAAVLLFSLFSCGQDNGDDEGDTPPVFSGETVVLNVYNWGEYISDGFEGALDSNKAFEEYFNEYLAPIYGFNVEVNYTTYANNEDMYSKLKSGAGNYDVVIPSDYMIEKMIGEGMLHEFTDEQRAKLSNLVYIGEDFLGENAVYDPGNRYSVPYTYGMLGVIYNTALIDEDDYLSESWELLWNPKYRGKLLQFNNQRDAFASAMYFHNIDVNTTDEAKWREALGYLLAQKELVQGYVNDEIFNKMTTASAAAAPYYAGDFLTMASENEDLSFYYPTEGTNYFVDAMCIPKNARNKDLAIEYINFMLSEEPAVANALYIGYASPNSLVLESEEYQEGMDELHEDWYEILYGKTPAEANANYDYDPAYRSFSPETQELVNALWESLKTENATELWVHVSSITITASVIALAVYTTYIRKKRSRHYRMRDREIAKARRA
ncbi:MAG: ABC transporter substrate-binding protein [Clostridia bacterium]|nr:ABC transporter substrate-binding protein [Clostridia bacterium]